MGRRQRNDIDPRSVIADYFRYVEQYRAASAALAMAENTFWPDQQIRGLLIELALKTYLCATDHIAWGHDLEELTSDSVNRGLVLTEKDRENVIKPTNELYCELKAGDVKYIARYPMPNRNFMVSVTPSHDVLDEMIQRILGQATVKRNEV